MAETFHSLTADQVQVGQRIAPLHVPVTATTVVQGAVASRDWQPQHHDHAWAQRVGTRDIFVNTPTQGGWISRYLTDWAGPTARLARFGYRMRASIYPGDTMVIAGVVRGKHTDASGCCWLDLAVEITVGDTVCTRVDVTLAVPERAGAETPWSRSGERWRVADLPPFPGRPGAPQ